MYSAVTRAIRVSVKPQYLEDESIPAEGQYLWAYTVRIENEGDRPVQLRLRYWRIVDANGKVDEVRGPGVVGVEPLIAPGEMFEYTSACPLSTTSGFMVGHYTMEADDGERFDVQVPAFSLDHPEQQTVVH